MTTRRFVWHPRRTSTPDSAPAELLAGKRILLVGEAGETLEAVGAALVAHGVVLVGQGHLRDADDRPDGIVDLTLDAGYPADWRPALVRTIGAIRSCYDAWSDEVDAGRTCYVAVTYLGGRMGYRDVSDRPWGGLWAGLAKTLHHELPNLNTKVVDVDPAELADLPSVLLRELYRWGSFEVGYAGGARYTLAPHPEDVAAPTVELGESDVVLISGGGRGIGYAAATSLAAKHGCRVVVTGRHRLPGPDDAWSELDDDGFKAHQRDLWIRATEDGTLAAVRAETNRRAQRRALAANVAAARADGLRFDYEVCDFTDRAQVDALLAKLGPALTGVVHNAGVDTATRLPRMSDDDIVRTVATKVDGFAHLFDALRDRPLKFFCNTGSMSGRLGGMVGQIAYSAANDGLTRLGQWADARAPFPVSTLCWPMWERVGMITNYDAGVRYMSPIGVEEGARRWVEELLAPARGEVTFLGALGSAMNPVQVRGFPMHREVPEFAAVYPRVFHLGTPVTFRPGVEFVADVLFDEASAPVLADFTVSGHPAVPVGVLLENALASAVWVHPAGDEPAVAWIDDVTVCLEGLRLDLGVLELRRTATLSTVGGRPVVDVRFDRPGLGPVVQLRLGYERLAVDLQPVAVHASAESTTPGPARWLGAIIPLATWHESGAVTRTAQVREPRPADLWTLPLTPLLALPLAALENIVRRVLRARPGRVLRITRLVPHGPPAAISRIDGDPVRGHWHVVDPVDGRPVLTASIPTAPTLPEDLMSTTVDPEVVHREFAEILVRVLGDYGVTAESITRDTDLHTDLQFESIGTDLPVLLGQLAAFYGGRVDAFAYLRGLDVDQLISLRVGALVDEVVRQLRVNTEPVLTPPPALLFAVRPPAPTGGDGTARRFLFVVPPMTGHVNPTIGVAAKLVERGHSVAWAGHEPLLRSVLGPDARVFDCAIPPATERWTERGPEVRSMRSIKVMWEEFLEPLAHTMVPGVRAAVEEFAPDVVVADQQALAGALVAGAAGLPWATSATTSAELIDMQASLPKVMDWLQGLFAGLRKAYGGPSSDLRYSPDLVLAYTTEDLVGPIPRREPIAYVGPSLYPRPSTVDFPWDRLDPHRSLVLISLGTVSAGAGSRFLREAVAAVRERSSRVQAVVVDPTGSVGPSDADVLVLPSVPQLELLGSVDAVICHAGHNTVCEALHHGLPLVVAPIRDDQPIVAAQVESVGAGVQVRFGLAEARHIGAALDAVLDGRGYRTAAGRVRAAFHDAGGADAAAAHLESYAARW